MHHFHLKFSLKFKRFFFQKILKKIFEFFKKIFSDDTNKFDVRNMNLLKDYDQNSEDSSKISLLEAVETVETDHIKLKFF